MMYIKPKKNIYSVILIISIMCIILSTTILIEKKQYSLNNEGICSVITGTDGCKAVQTSKYSRILGIDNPIYGIIGFSLLTIFTAMLIYMNVIPLKYLILSGNAIAGTAAIWFLYLQIFVLHKYCIFCMMVDILSLILFGMTLYVLIMHKQT